MAGDSSPADPAGPHSAAPGLAPEAAVSADTTLANADAERALLRLKQKLAGMEAGQALTCRADCLSDCSCNTCVLGFEAFLDNCLILCIL